MKPTVGRIVHFKRSASSSQPLAAIITFVHSDDCVDLLVLLPAASLAIPDPRPFITDPRPFITLTNVKLGDGELEWSWPPMVPVSGEPEITKPTRSRRARST